MRMARIAISRGASRGLRAARRGQMRAGYAPTQPNEKPRRGPRADDRETGPPARQPGPARKGRLDVEPCPRRVMLAQPRPKNRTGQFAQGATRGPGASFRRLGHSVSRGTVFPRKSHAEPLRSPPGRPRAREVVGVLALGRSNAKLRLLPAPISGNAISIARNTTLRPALSPSKHKSARRSKPRAARIGPRSTRSPQGRGHSLWGNPA